MLYAIDAKSDLEHWPLYYSERTLVDAPVAVARRKLYCVSTNYS